MATTATAPTRTKRATRAAARRKPRSAAKPRTARARRVTTTSTRPASRSAQVQALAERVVSIPVGVAAEARDRVAGTVGDLVTTTRTQLQRGTRNARRELDRQRRQARKAFDLDVVEGLSGRVENVVQNGVQTGRKLVNGAQDRIAKVV
jgi:hypothetical protein